MDISCRSYCVFQLESGDPENIRQSQHNMDVGQFSVRSDSRSGQIHGARG